MMLESPSPPRNAAMKSLNAMGRSPAHVATGVALCLGAVTASGLAAFLKSPGPANPGQEAALATLEKPPFQPPKAAFSTVWPPMFLLLTLSGIRIWNAPSSAARTRSLSIWTAMQGLHALSLQWGIKRPSATLATNLVTMGGALAYANEARKVDPPSAALIAPYVSWMAFANLLTEELWRRNRRRRDVR